MVHDKKLIGVCGETSLSNEKKSIITMMQVRLGSVHLSNLGLITFFKVYEYFLSHHLAKACSGQLLACPAVSPCIA